MTDCLRACRFPVITAAILLASCATGWRIVPVSPMAIDSLNTRVRVTRENGQRIVIDEPAIRGDSVVGPSDTGAVALPVAAIARVAVPAPSANSESGRFFGGIATALSALMVLAIVGRPF